MKSHVYLFVVLAAVVLLAACTDKGLDPIFYTLENERALADDRGMPDESNVYEVVKSGTRYFAAANRLFTRTETGNWSTVAPPVSGALCNTIEVFGGYLYAGFFTKDGTFFGLYRTLPDAISWDNTAFDAEVQNIQIGLIKAAGGNLYVVTAEQNGAVTDYYLYESDGTSYTGNAVTFDAVSPINLTIIDVVDDTTNIWVTAGPYLYLETGVRALTLQNGASDPVGSPGNPLAGLIYSTSLSQLYVAGKDGKLWMRDGGGWNPPASVSEDVRFSGFVDVTGISGDVLVGSEGTGYFRLILGDVNDTERFKEYNISALYSGAINSFFLDGTSLFACTNNTGLWRATYSGTEWIWVQE